MGKEKVTEEIIEELVNNEKLLKFVESVILYKKILESEMKYLFLTSLISSDTLLSADDCKKSIEILSFIKSNIDLICVSDKDVKKNLNFINDGLKIAKRDLKIFEKNVQ